MAKIISQTFPGTSTLPRVGNFEVLLPKEPTAWMHPMMGSLDTGFWTVFGSGSSGAGHPAITVEAINGGRLAFKIDQGQLSSSQWTAIRTGYIFDKACSSIDFGTLEPSVEPFECRFTLRDSSGTVLLQIEFAGQEARPRYRLVTHSGRYALWHTPSGRLIKVGSTTSWEQTFRLEIRVDGHPGIQMREIYIADLVCPPIITGLPEMLTWTGPFIRTWDEGSVAGTLQSGYPGTFHPKICIFDSPSSFTQIQCTDITVHDFYL